MASDHLHDQEAAAAAAAAAAEGGSTDLFEARSLVWNFTFSFIRSMILGCAVELGVFDAIHRHSGKPVTVPQLVLELGLPPPRSLDLARLMRMLEFHGFFASQATVTEMEEEEKGYVLARPYGYYVQERAAPLVRLVMEPALIMPFLRLSSWFRSEDQLTAFHAFHGMSMWEYASITPEFNSKFNASMTHDSELVVEAFLAKCRPVLLEGGDAGGGARSLVDVGGNNGKIARAISAAFPHLKCTVFDLPHVVAGQPSTETVEFLAGNMFEFVPSADVLLLKNILHDYNDEDCVKILRQCKKAVKSKVVVLDIVLNFAGDNCDGGGEDKKKDDSKKNISIENQLFMDMKMVVGMEGGREREEKEWNKVFMEAGFSSYKMTPILDIYCLIEVYP